jgi:hypothetical protein
VTTVSRAAPAAEPQAMALRVIGAQEAQPLASDSPYALPPTATPAG